MSSSVTIETLADGLVRTRGAEVNLALRVRGSGPAIVLLHGTSANHAVWEPVADALAASATVITIDQRGHGRSEKPLEGYAGRDFADDVVTVLDAVGIDRAIVGGHSLGARNAWLTAAFHPERVSGVLAVDYTPFVEAAVLDELDVRVAGGFRDFEDVAEIERYLRDRYVKIQDGAVARRARWGYRPEPDGRLRALASPDAMRQLIDGLRTPWDAEFRAVAAPMTHVRGDSSAIVSTAAWESARAARPADRWVVAEGADHYVPEEQPELIVAELQLLLDA